ncbi:hypothetical protein QYF36_020066 [Acer negundo]|nr:hypothetical protein QYF36_020066 [Acer negundo]
MIAGYVSNGVLDLDVEMLNSMRLDGFELDVVTWNTVMDAYYRMGLCDEAWKIFKHIKEPSIISWTILISGYSRIGKHEVSPSIFRDMMNCGASADSNTLSSVPVSCRHLGALMCGKEIHSYGVKAESGIGFYSPTGLALLTIYAKPGRIQDAKRLALRDTSYVVRKIIAACNFIEGPISLAADGLNRLGYSCDSTFGNNTASAVYGLNRGRLFTQKLYADGANSIYSNTSDGGDPDKVYGLYLCRRDVTNSTCQSCINEAIGYAISEKACENTKSAITWYAECMVRYSDKPFSFTFESVPAFKMSDEHNFTASDPVEFRKALNQSFSHLIADAITSELKYATDIVNISSSVTLYTMGQCIPALSKEDCRDCLNSASQLVEHERKGSRFLYPSCGARFELYQFWNSPAGQEPVSPVEAPPPVPNKTGGTDLGRNRKENRAWIPITISLLAVVVVVLLGSLIWQIRRRNKNKEEESNSQEVQLLRLREDLTLEATQHFSEENKLGEGGFGPVYKGILADDFGMARIFGEKQSEANTIKVVGTYGYMAPEYAMEEHGLSLLNYTWKLWCEEQAPKLMDPEDQTDRPSMSSVVAMLVTDNMRLPQPTQPAFSVGRAARQGQSLSDVNFFSNEATRSQGQSSSNASDFSNEAARRV